MALFQNEIILLKFEVELSHSVNIKLKIYRFCFLFLRPWNHQTFALTLIWVISHRLLFNFVPVGPVTSGGQRPASPVPPTPW